MVDTWCNVVLPGTTRRARGRLVSHEGDLLLLSPGPVVRNLGPFSAIDLRSRSATLEDGVVVRWSATCSCGWPLSLKGPVENILVKAQVVA